ncbi:hypothetical protein BH09SUM1_BH09SUM1_33360 [soil metagenome]
MFSLKLRALRAAGIVVAAVVVTGQAAANPVMFVTQTPFGADFANIGSTFGNHRATATSAPRGGDLWIQYDNGTRRNLTQLAGFGNNIAVRDPMVHWDGQKALFSMVVGGVTKDNNTPVFFQIYQVTGLGALDTVTITKLTQQNNYNNVTPFYGTDDSIFFTSDRPHNGDAKLYPQLDEYESTPTNTGLWHMNANGTGLKILDHSPSGDFSPFIDSFGRIIMTRWDHLQRDQQADDDIVNTINGDPLNRKATMFDSESSTHFRPIQPLDETFPEALTVHGNDGTTVDPVWDADHQAGEVRNRFNQFFPWMMNEDGTAMETINHVGRHELARYTPGSRTTLPDASVSGPNISESILHMREDPTHPGRYYGTSSPEFGTHASGQIIYMDGAPSINAKDMHISYVTHEDTQFPIDDSETPTVNDIGILRDPLPKSDGTLWAAHSQSVFADRSTAVDPGGAAPMPLSSRYAYRIRKLENRGDGVFEPTTFMTAAGISETISYFDNQPYRTVSYSGLLWELQPVEVMARTRPTTTTDTLPTIEKNVAEAELGGAAGVAELKLWLTSNNLALLVSRDVTVRGDKQQDFRLKVFGSSHQTTDGVGTPKEIAWMQFMEGQQVRGYESMTGRRVLAQTMDNMLNPIVSGAPGGAVRAGTDGSMAAFVPAQRALSWQMTENNGTPSVRERYWLTFKAGEIRTCANCHGLNDKDVFNHAGPTNDPQALKDLLQWWKANNTAATVVGWQTY